MTGIPFASLQRAADLCRVAEAGLRQLEATFGPPARRLVLDLGCRIGESEETLPLIDPLEAAASRPEAPGLFQASMAVLLADCLQNGVSPHFIAGAWPRTSGAVRELPIAARTRLVGGFLALEQVATGTLAEPPANEEGRSTDRAPILGELRTVAGALTEDELRHISRADYGKGASRHLEGLRAVLRAGCRMTPEQAWYPSEVVELVSHVPDQPGFAGATALLMIGALMDGDLQDSLSFRWANCAPAYGALPAAATEALYAGFRHLFETDPTWNPYQFALFDPADHHAHIIPPAADRFLLPAEGASP